MFSKGEKMFFLKKQIQPNLVEGVFFLFTYIRNLGSDFEIIIRRWL